MTYCDLAVLKVSVGIDADDESSDAALTGVLEAADETIDNFCHRTFAVPGEDAVPTSRICPVVGSVIRTADIASASSIVVRSDGDDDGVFETLIASDVELETYPLNAIADGRPIEALRLRGSRCATTVTVQVTALYGWPAVPASIVEAARLQAARLWKRRDAALGIAGVPELGTQRVLAKVDADVQVLLTPYVLDTRPALYSVRITHG